MLMKSEFGRCRMHFVQSCYFTPLVVASDMAVFLVLCHLYFSSVQVLTLMDLVCKACAELMEDAVKQNMRIRVLSSDKAKVDNP